jgi:hypothetical protein
LALTAAFNASAIEAGTPLFFRDHLRSYASFALETRK